jgi:hypothetical protein
MAKKKKKKNEKEPFFSEKIKRIIIGLVLLLFSLIGALGAFDGLAGNLGDILREEVFIPLFGGMAALVPFLVFISGLIFLRTEYERFRTPLTAGFFLILLGATSFFTVFGSMFETIKDEGKIGGLIGKSIGIFFEKLIGPTASLLIFFTSTIIGLIIFWHLLYKEASLIISSSNSTPSTSALLSILS